MKWKKKRKANATIRLAITSMIIIFRFKFPSGTKQSGFFSLLLDGYHFISSSTSKRPTPLNRNYRAQHTKFLATVQHVDDNDINENKGTTAPWGNSHE